MFYVYICNLMWEARKFFASPFLCLSAFYVFFYFESKNTFVLFKKKIVPLHRLSVEAFSSSYIPLCFASAVR